LQSLRRGGRVRRIGQQSYLFEKRGMDVGRRKKRGGRAAYFSPSWTAFQADRGRDFSVIVDGVSD
jgi:hypothetical protein